MHSATYIRRRRQLTTYFDQTAAAAWTRLTSSEPVGRIRATVRAGRDEMRATLLGWLPDDLSGCTLLDAGCGTGALAIEAARRGADVLAIDTAAAMIHVAEQRVPQDLAPGRIRFVVGDMLDQAEAEFDYIVAMDSLIHYAESDVLATVTQLTRHARRAVLFTFAPHTRALALMHMTGRLLPLREDRAPAIVPLKPERLMNGFNAVFKGGDWQTARTKRISSGFYKSQGLELKRPCVG